MSDDLRITTHAGEVLDTHQERVARALVWLEQWHKRTAKSPSIDDCVLLASAAYKKMGEHTKWYADEYPLGFWFTERSRVRPGADTLDGHVPALLLNSRRGRRRIVAWAQATMQLVDDWRARDAKRAVENKAREAA